MTARLHTAPYRHEIAVTLVVIAACSSPQETETSVKDIPVPQALPEPSLRLADLLGAWENVDSEADHVTRVEIHRSDSTGTFLVRMWGSCEPVDCFWGDNTDPDTVGGPNNQGAPELSLEWDFKPSTSSQRVRLIERDLLQIDSHTRFREADIEFDVTDRFRRTDEP